MSEQSEPSKLEPVWQAIAVVFMAGVTIADKTCGIYLNIIDRGGRWARDTDTEDKR